MREDLIRNNTKGESSAAAPLFGLTRSCHTVQFVTPARRARGCQQHCEIIPASHVTAEPEFIINRSCVWRVGVMIFHTSGQKLKPHVGERGIALTSGQTWRGTYATYSFAAQLCNSQSFFFSLIINVIHVYYEEMEKYGMAKKTLPAFRENLALFNFVPFSCTRQSLKDLLCLRRERKEWGRVRWGERKEC